MSESDADPTLTRPIRLIAPAGLGPFLVQRFSGNEGISRLFEYELELLSTDLEVAFEKIMTQPVVLIVEGDDDRPRRVVHGHISRFIQAEATGRHMQYFATVTPFIWFLTRTADCRIFQEKTTPQIVREVLSGRGFDEVDDRLTGTFPKWEYCVQYRETDFNFISRLLEHEGIYYFFEHTFDEQSGEAKHTLVLCDSPSNHDLGPGCAALPFGRFLTGGEIPDSINDWSVMNHVHSDQSTLIDFDFKKPKKILRSSQFEAPDFPPPPGEIFDYPGGFVESGDGDRLAGVRASQHSIRRTVSRGTTNARGLRAGLQFEMDGHPREDQNKKYLCITSQHSGFCDAGESKGGGAGEHLYTCSFEAVDAVTQYRPLRTTPKPMIQGPQTAMVVGPSGEEIHTDEFGRVKVIFHWDRVGDPSKGDTSCFIRVAQVWAGKKWGAMYIPRVGHEVIVEFLEGDPDRPIVTGRVYNGEAKPPYDLPANKTVSTLKSLSSKGGGGFNELRFEDMKGCEQVFINAERNMDVRVKASLFETVGGERHERTYGDLREWVKGERHTIITGDDVSKHDFNRSAIVTEQDILETKEWFVTASGAFGITSTEESSLKCDAALTVSGKEIVISAQTKISLKVGGSSVVIDPTGVTIKGAMVTLDGSMIKIASGPGSSPGSSTQVVGGDAGAPKEAAEADHAEPGAMTDVARGGSTPAPAKKKSFTPDPKKSQDPSKTFIEIRLKDQKGNPVAREPFEVTLPDGETVASGNLDEDGFARVDGIDPGSCSVSFPRRDNRAVRKQ